MKGPVRVHTLVTGDFVENGYILHREGSTQAVLVDPGAEPERWLAELDSRSLRPVLVLATHAHLDHVGAVAGIQGVHKAPFRLHAQEEQVLDTLDWQCDLFSLPRIPRPRLDGHVREGERVEAGGIGIEPLETPGHTPGGLCYHVKEAGTVFTGDSLFAGTIGRTDLPGGDHETLIGSLRRLCSILPDETKVLPGHGPGSTVGRERTTNPFFRVGR